MFAATSCETAQICGVSFGLPSLRFANLAAAIARCDSCMVSQSGFEVILGAFAAGMVVGQATRGADGMAMREKIEAVSFGWSYPPFFSLAPASSSTSQRSARILRPCSWYRRSRCCSCS
jgi:hypothetical protein